MYIHSFMIQITQLRNAVWQEMGSLQVIIKLMVLLAITLTHSFTIEMQFLQEMGHLQEIIKLIVMMALIMAVGSLAELSLEIRNM